MFLFALSKKYSLKLDILELHFGNLLAPRFESMTDLLTLPAHLFSGAEQDTCQGSRSVKRLVYSWRQSHCQILVLLGNQLHLKKKKKGPLGAVLGAVDNAPFWSLSLEQSLIRLA